MTKALKELFRIFFSRMHRIAEF